MQETYRSEEITINLDATGWEYLNIEISHNSRNAKKYVLTNAYRPPERFVDELNVFIQEFSSLLNFVQDLNKTSFVCGDFNINLLEIDSNPHYNDYFESIYSKGCFPRITMPTRIQPPSFSLIDNILCNSLNDAAKSVSGVLITDIQYRSASLSINPASRAGACTDCEYIECTIAIIIIVILVRSLFLVDIMCFLVSLTNTSIVNKHPM